MQSTQRLEQCLIKECFRHVQISVGILSHLTSINTSPPRALLKRISCREDILIEHLLYGASLMMKKNVTE